ncbi:Kazal-type serine protease inhibitor domain protein [Nitrosomonas sp. JL21]|uniref:Kazal-type serine protease inhibitor domain protein n=1 Tax=Nitrosomonas sp. JL21 TaxID=153949 RepID=UPI00137220BB|nr:Kazal-type serine protease inhibitor domain protein [Nitrosomonas sp. JL21]MBL8496634.1 Kazal-type serine protease inhibitor domain protein [Nitrosomonas sp.]MCC7092124.1 Kazal-type serine protease inhibitor domain protein [Nitrosomonas sp.]MXS76451.1 Kazal-type serine protease inhibitor domain protein [Nitrosomonas sp. JL21]
MKQLDKMTAFSVLLGLYGGLGLIGMPGISQAEPAKYAETVKTEYQYAAKVACSLLLPHQDGTLARGTYRTLVNIHNPTNKKITIAAKVALATQFGAEPGPFDVTPFKSAVLQPDGAVGVSCFDIAGYFCPINGVCVDFAFLEGFLVVKSPVPLDVVSVYTARHTDGDVESIDVQTVQPHKLQETVRIGSTEPSKSGEGKRIDYPPKGSSAYNGQKPKQMCGGIAGFPCPDGMKCVDDPADDCDPAKNGADCAGMCVK